MNHRLLISAAIGLVMVFISTMWILQEDVFAEQPHGTMTKGQSVVHNTHWGLARGATSYPRSTVDNRFDIEQQEARTAEPSAQAIQISISDFGISAPDNVSTGSDIVYGITLTNGGNQPVNVVIFSGIGATISRVNGPGCTQNRVLIGYVVCRFKAQRGRTAIYITARAGNQCPRTVSSYASLDVAGVTDVQTVATSITCPPPRDYGQTCGRDANGAPCQNPLVCINSRFGGSILHSINYTCDRYVKSAGSVGGQSGGDESLLECPMGHAMVGVRVRSSGNRLRNIALYCVRVNSDGTWNGNASRSPWLAPGSDGNLQTLICPRNRAVAETSGEAGGYVDRIGLSCRSMSDAYTTAGTGMHLGEVGGKFRTSTRFNRSCPENMPAIGFYGRSEPSGSWAGLGGGVIGLTLICGR